MPTQVGPAEREPVGRDLGAAWQQSGHRQRQCALAAAGFACQSDDFAGIDVEVDTVDGAYVDPGRCGR